MGVAYYNRAEPTSVYLEMNPGDFRITITAIARLRDWTGAAAIDAN